MGCLSIAPYAAYDASGGWTDISVVHVIELRMGRRRGGHLMWTEAVVIRTAVLAIVGLMGLTIDLYAGRPLATDDADPVERGRVEVEFGVELETTTQSYTLTAPFAFSVGLTDWLAVGIKPSVLYVDDQDASPRR